MVSVCKLILVFHAKGRLKPPDHMCVLRYSEIMFQNHSFFLFSVFDILFDFYLAVHDSCFLSFFFLGDGPRNEPIHPPR